MNKLNITAILCGLILLITSCGPSVNKTDDGSTTAKSVDEVETTAKSVDELETTAKSVAEGTNANQKDQTNSAVELIQIGKQFWSAKCLDVSTYRNGDTIQKVEAPYQWGKLKEGAWCYYDNKTANGTKYGKLYNWYAVNDPRGIAPKGYHIPTRDDIIILNDFLGKSSEGSTKIKSASSIDELKGGYRNFEGTFTGIGEILKWWSSTEQNAEYAYCRELINIHGNLGKPIYDKHCGFPLRFLKD